MPMDYLKELIEGEAKVKNVKGSPEKGRLEIIFEGARRIPKVSTLNAERIRQVHGLEFSITATDIGKGVITARAISGEKNNPMLVEISKTVAARLPPKRHFWPLFHIPLFRRG